MSSDPEAHAAAAPASNAAGGLHDAGSAVSEAPAVATPAPPSLIEAPAPSADSVAEAYGGSAAERAPSSDAQVAGPSMLSGESKCRPRDDEPHPGDAGDTAAAPPASASSAPGAAASTDMAGAAESPAAAAAPAPTSTSTPLARDGDSIGFGAPKAEPVSDETAADCRVIIGNVARRAGDDDGRELSSLLSGAILRLAGQNSGTECSEKEPPCFSCSIVSSCAKDDGLVEFVARFRTAVGASAAMGIRGLEFRGQLLSLRRPSDYAVPAEGDPADSLDLRSLTAAHSLHADSSKVAASPEGHIDPTPKRARKEDPVEPPRHDQDRSRDAQGEPSQKQSRLASPERANSERATKSSEPANSSDTAKVIEVDLGQSDVTSDDRASSSSPPRTTSAPQQSSEATVVPPATASGAGSAGSAKDVPKSSTPPAQGAAGSAKDGPKSSTPLAQGAAGSAPTPAKDGPRSSNPPAQGAEASASTPAKDGSSSSTSPPQGIPPPKPVPLPPDEALPDNHYEALGITVTSTVVQIKKAYHAKSKLYHPDKNHHDLHATAKFQRIVEAYTTLSNAAKRSQYDAALIMKEACGSLGVQNDPRAAQFVQRHSMPGRVIEALKVDAKYMPHLLGKNGFTLHTLKMTSGADMLTLQSQLSQHAQILLAGAPNNILQAKALIEAEIAMFNGARAPRDGVVLIVPPHLTARISQVASQFQMLYLQTGSAARFASTDRIVVQGGMRVPQAVVQLQHTMEWKLQILMPTGQTLDAWCYAHLCEAAGVAAVPMVNASQAYQHLLPPNHDPDAAATRRLFCLALGATEESTAKETLVDLTVRTLEAHRANTRHVTGALARAATSVPVHAEHAALSPVDQTKLLLSLHALAATGALLAPRFANSPQLKSLTAILQAINDTRDGLLLRARGFTAIRDAVPDDGAWHKWDELLPPAKPESSLASFWGDLRAWVTERKHLLSCLPPPAEWLSSSLMMTAVLRPCAAAPQCFCDPIQGLRRAPTPPAPPPGSPPTPQVAGAASVAAAVVPPQAPVAPTTSTTIVPDDCRQEEQDATLTLVELTEDILYGLARTIADGTVSIGLLTSEAQKKLTTGNSAEKLRKPWYESHRNSFELKKVGEDWRVALTKDAKARAHARTFEREADRMRGRELRIAEEVLPRLSAENLPRTLRLPELAGLLCVLSRGQHRLGDDLPGALLKRICKRDNRTPKDLVKEAAPFAPALLMRAVVALEKNQKLRWDKDALDYMLQAAALDMHDVENRPRAPLPTAAAALWAAARKPFDERLSGNRCLLVSSAALRLQLELECERVVLSPDRSAFRPFAQMCAWLAHLVVTANIGSEVKTEVLQAFKKLAKACQEMGNSPDTAPCDPEGLCRLAMACALVAREVKDKDRGKNNSEVDKSCAEALEGLARVCVQKALDDSFGWKPQQIAVLASAFAAAEVPHEGLFRKIGLVAERHTLLGNEWTSDQLLKLLNSAWQLDQLDKLEGLLTTMQADKGLDKHVQEAHSRDVPVIMAVLVLVKDKKLLEDLAKGQTEKLKSFSLQGLVSLLKSWPDSVDLKSSSLATFKAAILRECISNVGRKAPTPQELAILVESMQGDAQWAAARCSELASSPALLAASVPSEKDASLQELHKTMDGYFGLLSRAGATSPRLEALCAARIVMAVDRTSSSTLDVRDVSSAALLLPEKVLGGMPAALAALAERLARARLRIGSSESATSSLRKLCDRFVKAAASVESASSSEMPRSGDSELDSWVQRLERCAAERDEGASRSSPSNERRFDWLEQQATKKLPAVVRELLGSSWLALLLVRSRRIAWSGGKTIVLEVPRPRAAVRRLIEAVGSSIGTALRAEADALGLDAPEIGAPTPSVPSNSGSRPPAPTIPNSRSAATPAASPRRMSTDGGSPQTASSTSRAQAPVPGAIGAAVPTSTTPRREPLLAPLARISRPGAIIVRGGTDAGMADTIAGTYMPSSQNHGRGVYRRVEPVTDAKVLLYYWDDRDGEENMGWWFGPEVGGEEVWAQNPGVASSPEPPQRGWVVLHSGEVDMGITVTKVEVAKAPTPTPTSAATRGVLPSSAVGVGPRVAPRPRGTVGAAVPSSACGVGGVRQTPPTPSAPIGAIRRAPPPPAKIPEQRVGVASPSAGAAISRPSFPATPTGAAGQAKPGKQPPRYDTARATELRKWLEGLDDGAGAMVQYFDVLASEFDADLAQIAAAKVEGGEAGGILGVVDPSFWDTVRVSKAGHKMLFARGIAKL